MTSTRSRSAVAWSERDVGEHSDAIFPTSSYLFANAAEAAARFAGEAAGPVYGRFSNPTVAAFERRLAELEGGEVCIAMASGMSAIAGLVLSLLESGDHIVAPAGLFGATVQLLDSFLLSFGITSTLVPGCDPADIRAACTHDTRLILIETPSNPLGEVHDIRALAAVAAETDAILAVDNCLCTPVLQRPLALGADVVIHSATKHLDGQGRILGGALVGSRRVLQPKVPLFMRLVGPSLSPFNAWILVKGLETLPLRMRAQSAAALAVAERLEQHPAVARVHYSFLPSSPQAALARKQQHGGGAVIGIDVAGDRDAAWTVIDETRMLSITANLGDVRTTITHPATTTHARMPESVRQEAGISDSLIRVAVGLEAVEDIVADLERGLDIVAGRG